MVIKNLKKLLLPVIVISLLLGQTTQAFVYRVDVAAKMVTLPSGEKKIILTLLGSDNHQLAKDFPRAQSVLIDQLSKKINDKKDSIKILFEGAFTSSQWCQFDDQLEQKINAFLCNKNHQISTLQTFCLPAENLCTLFPHLDRPSIDGLNTECIEVRQAHNIATSCGLSHLIDEHANFFDHHLSKLFMKNLFKQIKSYQETTPDRDFQPIFKQLSHAYNAHLKETTALSSFQYKNFLNEGPYGEALFVEALEDNVASLDSMIEANALWLLSQSFTEQYNRFIILAGGLHTNPQVVHEEVEDEYSENSIGLATYLEVGGYTSLESLDIRQSLIEGMQKIAGKVQRQLITKDHEIIAAYEKLFCKLAADIANFITQWTLKTDAEILTLLCPEDSFLDPHEEVQNSEPKDPELLLYDNSNTTSWCTLL